MRIVFRSAPPKINIARGLYCTGWYTLTNRYGNATDSSSFQMGFRNQSCLTRNGKFVARFPKFSQTVNRSAEYCTYPFLDFRVGWGWGSRPQERFSHPNSCSQSQGRAIIFELRTVVKRHPRAAGVFFVIGI